MSAERAFSHGGAEHAKARAFSAGELTGAETAARGASVLQARFEERGGLTRLVSRYHTSPIKIAKAFPLGSGAGVLVMDVSPGMLSGDRYELDWSLGAGASVQISNQSFLKVHPCEEEGGASLRQRFALENGAVCEHLPEPVMLYEDASLLADTEVRLAPGAVWMQTEVLCPGRTLRGEVFRYRRLDNRLTVYADGELIFRQRQRVEPRAQQLAAPGSWHRFTHWGTFCLFGRGADAGWSSGCASCWTGCRRCLAGRCGRACRAHGGAASSCRRPAMRHGRCSACWRKSGSSRARRFGASRRRLSSSLSE